MTLGPNSPDWPASSISADIGDAKHTIMLGDKNDALASPVGRDGVSPNPGFSLENLLSYHIAGDHRADENVALTAVHTVWHREHNFQADRIMALHPEWSAEEIFQAREDHQHGRIPAHRIRRVRRGRCPAASRVHRIEFSGYNPDVNPGISDEFAGAMYRVGHSMINETIPFTDAAGHTQEVPLFSAFLNPAMFDGSDPSTSGVGGAAAMINRRGPRRASENRRAGRGGDPQQAARRPARPLRGQYRALLASSASRRSMSSEPM